MEGGSTINSKSLRKGGRGTWKVGGRAERGEICLPANVSNYLLIERLRKSKRAKNQEREKE